MSSIAILGAGGFVGTRLVESLYLDGAAETRAVVRAYRNFASLSRFGPPLRIDVADAEVAGPALGRALQGASTVVNLTTGSPASIDRTTRAIYETCLSAGVRRLIHLSSAVVFGEVPSDRIDDDSPPDVRHWMPYARAKARAEVWLRERSGSGPLQVAVLRPGIVWGVRSSHTLDIARSLLAKSAYLVEGGRGVFNGINVDNLVACIRACHEHPGDVSGFYNVSDREALTWRDFYAALGPSLGCDVGRLPDLPGDRFPWSTGAVIDYVRSLPLMSDLFHRLKASLSPGVKQRVKALLAGSYDYEQAASAYATKPAVDREMWSLQRVRHKLPVAKFERHFGFTPPVSFEQGCRKTLDWLRSLGYVPAQTGASHHGVSP
jgi:nucleoside-diphosphate-sugar epimerase